MTARTDIAPPRDSAAGSGSDHRLVGQLTEAWNHLSAVLVGMPISDPRWKPAVDWLNANRRFQMPISRLPNVPALAASPTQDSNGGTDTQNGN